MSFATLHDIVNNAFLGQSVAPLSRTASVNGAAVDCTGVDGPINGLSIVGAATGTPDSFSVTAKLQECDTSGGTFTDIVTQSSPGAQAAAGVVPLRGIREKQFVRIVQTIAFVNGTSPAIPTAGILIGQNRSFGKQPGDAGY